MVLSLDVKPVGVVPGSVSMQVVGGVHHGKKLVEGKDFVVDPLQATVTVNPHRYAQVIPPTCPYCGDQSKLVDGQYIYPHRTDLRTLKFWRCDRCDAHVGCHKLDSYTVLPSGERVYSDGTAPMGRMANAKLRKLKMQAHSAFDPIWKSYSAWAAHPAFSPKEKNEVMRRKALYRWLSKELGIPYDECHIGMFDESKCLAVISLCTTKES